MSFVDLGTLTMHRRAEMEGRINTFDEKCDRAINDIKKLKTQARGFLTQLNCDPAELKDKFLNVMKKLDEYTYLITDFNLALGQIEEISSDQTPVLESVKPLPPAFNFSPNNLMDALSEPTPSTPLACNNLCRPEKQKRVKVPKQDQALILFSSSSTSSESVPIRRSEADSQEQHSLPEKMDAVKLEEASPPSPECALPAQSLLEPEQEYRGVITVLSGPSFWLITDDSQEFSDFMNDIKELVEKTTALTFEQARLLNYCVYYNEETNFFFRAMIIREDQEEVDKLNLFLVDTGEVRAAPAHQLRAMPPQLCHRPPYARLCHLAGIDLEVYNDKEILKKFEGFMTNYINEPCTFIVDENESESTAVIVICNGKVVNDLLVDRGLAVAIDKGPVKEEPKDVPHSSTGVAKFMPQTAPDVVRYSQHGQSDTASFSPNTSAEVARDPPNTSAEVARHPPNTSVKVIRHQPYSSGDVTRHPSNTLPKFARPPNNSAEVARYAPSTSAEVARFSPHQRAEVASYSAHSSVELANLSPHSSLNVASYSQHSSVTQGPPEMVESDIDLDAPEYDDPVVAVTGYHNRDEEDICKHYRGGPDKTCFKGFRCTKKHILKHLDGWTLDRVEVPGKLPALPLPAPGSWHKVLVTNVAHFDRIYVHLLEDNPPREEVREFGVVLPPKTLSSLIRDMNSAAANNSYKPLTLTPAPGELVAARYPPDKRWYRARVFTVTHHDQSVQVQYVDYGTIMWVKENEIRVLEPRFCVLPAQAVRCKLAGVHMSSTNTEDWVRAKRELTDTIQERELHAHVIARDFDEITVDLVGDDDYSITQLLAARGVFELREYNVCDDSNVTQKHAIP